MRLSDFHEVHDLVRRRERIGRFLGHIEAGSAIGVQAESHYECVDLEDVPADLVDLLRAKVTEAGAAIDAQLAALGVSVDEPLAAEVETDDSDEETEQAA